MPQSRKLLLIPSAMSGVLDNVSSGKQIHLANGKITRDDGLKNASGVSEIASVA
jgi:hypothetical protein